MAGESVTVVIDGREVEVAAGTGLVEAAASADIEIPVFCYEPRIGPAVGACRMCLVEIEGMPKLQTACSTTVRDGMVVSTAGKKAREAQEAVLEFLLINHPLDCPVCDKGGECPLQDQAYRWGNGTSRFVEFKRTADKPIPVSPLIALDRERCVLCYRCTRFSDEVAGDRQLVPRERGAKTVISTFEGRPYEGHFSGNITELCPVGALTSTQYRFRGRPWDSPDHPAVCGLCPVGCNTAATVREGEVLRVLARRNDAVDQGWLCDRGRFSYASLTGEGRIAAPYERGHRGRIAPHRRTTPISMEGALERLHGWLGSGTPATWVLSGAETLEEAFVIRRIADRTGGEVVALDGGSAAVLEPAATIVDAGAAALVIVLGDADLAEVAPMLDLRVRAALRGGARVICAGIGGSLLEQAGAVHEAVAPGGLDAYVESLATRAAAGELAADRVVVVARDGHVPAAAAAALAAALGLDRDGSGFLTIPAAPNARGLAAIDVPSATLDEIAERSRGAGLVVFGVDPTRRIDAARCTALMTGAAWSAYVGTYENALSATADLVIPGAAPLEKEGTLVTLDGRLQHTGATVPMPGGFKPDLYRLGGLARRLGERVPGTPGGVYRLLAATWAHRLPAATYAQVPVDGAPGVHGGTAAAPDARATAPVGDGDVTLFVSPSLYDGLDVAGAPRMAFLRDRATIVLARDDASRLGLARGDEVTVGVAGAPVRATVAVSRRLGAGYARMHCGAPGLPVGAEGYHAATIARREAAPAAASATTAGGQGA